MGHTAQSQATHCLMERQSYYGTHCPVSGYTLSYGETELLWDTLPSLRLHTVLWRDRVIMGHTAQSQDTHCLMERQSYYGTHCPVSGYTLSLHKTVCILGLGSVSHPM